MIEKFNRLSSDKKLELINELKRQYSLHYDFLSVKRETSDFNKCVRCQSSNIVKFGSYNDKSRFKCKSCNRTFSELTGTSLSYLKKIDIWNDFVDLTLEDNTIRQISEKLGISTKTAFEWRHRLFYSFSETMNKKFTGVVETDDSFFHFNQKGRKKNYVKTEKTKRGVSDDQIGVMFTIDRTKTMDISMVKRGRVSVDSLRNVLVSDRLSKDNVIFCTDYHRSIESFMRSQGFEQVQLKAVVKERIKDGIFHIQNANSLQKRCKDWIKFNFNNVSTKYLQNYLNLFMMKEIMRLDNLNKVDFLRHSLVEHSVLLKKKLSEETYQDFLRLS